MPVASTVVLHDHAKHMQDIRPLGIDQPARRIESRPRVAREVTGVAVCARKRPLASAIKISRKKNDLARDTGSAGREGRAKKGTKPPGEGTSLLSPLRAETQGLFPIHFDLCGWS